MRGERLRLLLGLLVFAVGLRFAYDLVVQPDDLFSIRHVGGANDAADRLIARCVVAGGLRRAAGRAPSGWWSSLSNHRVLITSNFTGADLVLFGTVERDAGRRRCGAAATTSW